MRVRPSEIPVAGGGGMAAAGGVCLSEDMRPGTSLWATRVSRISTVSGAISMSPTLNCCSTPAAAFSGEWSELSEKNWGDEEQQKAAASGDGVGSLATVTRT